MRDRIWKKHYAIPAEHGAWIWWIGPFGLGVAAAGNFKPDLILLAIAALAAYLARHPASLLIKVQSGRRSQDDRVPALFWAGVYSALSLATLFVLILAGHTRLISLALPGLLVFAWHMLLVRRQSDRGQPGIEIVVAGVLALTGPAAYWVAGGDSTQTAWILWGLSWFQSAASIVHIYLRLSHRKMNAPPSNPWRMGARSLAYHSFNFLGSTALAIIGWIPLFAPAAFGLMLIDALEAVMRPAIGIRPTAIGLRQLAASSVFFLLLILTYLG
jgi:hypothetical protein